MSETALARRVESDEPGGTCRGIVRVGDMDGLWRFAGLLVQSQCLPDSWEDQATAFIALQAGSEVGMSLVQTTKCVMVINKKPSLYDDGPLALCMASGKFDHSQHEETWDEATKEAVVTVCRIGGKPKTGRFSIAKAERAGLVRRNQNYGLYPDRMCTRRARAFALRDAFPDVLMGLSVKEEIEDVIDVTAEPVQTTTASESLGASLRAQADKAPAERSTADPLAPAEAVEQKKALLDRIREVCVAISGGNYGSTAPVLDEYRPIDMTQSAVNLTACLGGLLAMLPENHKLRQPEPEEKKRGRGRPKGSTNKPTDEPPAGASANNQPPAGDADPFVDAPAKPVADPAREKLVAEIGAYAAKMGVPQQDAFPKRHGVSGKTLEQCTLAELESMAREARDESDPSIAANLRQSIGSLKTQVSEKGGNPNEVFAKYGLLPGGTKRPTDCLCSELRGMQKGLSEALAALMAAKPEEQPPAGDWFGTTA
jgi:hypothetical protein